jgi:hypothetical protein
VNFAVSGESTADREFEKRVAVPPEDAWLFELLSGKKVDPAP